MVRGGMAWPLHKNADASVRISTLVETSAKARNFNCHIRLIPRNTSDTDNPRGWVRGSAPERARLRLLVYLTRVPTWVTLQLPAHNALTAIQIVHSIVH